MIIKLNVFVCLIYFPSCLYSNKMNLKSFLRSSNNLAFNLLSNSQNIGKLSLVIGNEAADADSIISSLSLAYLKNFAFSSNNIENLSVPIVSIPKKDIALRVDTIILLKEIGIDASDLICTDEIPIDYLSTRGDLSLTLVDHNYMSSSFSSFSDRVCEIIDHHKDMGYYPHVSGLMRNIAFEKDHATAGSCCTLIAEKYLSEYPDLLDENISTLLLGVILLDTVNMCPKMNKGTPRDLDIVNILKQKCKIDSTDLYNKLTNAKYDMNFWLGLSAENAFRLDFKSFRSTNSSVGISAVLLPLKDLIIKKDFQEFVKSHLQLYEYFVVMSFYFSPNPSRQLIIFSKNHDNLENINSIFLSDRSDFGFEPIILEVLNLDPMINCYAYNQLNLKNSRKQFAPYFLEII